MKFQINNKFLKYHAGKREDAVFSPPEGKLEQHNGYFSSHH